MTTIFSIVTEIDMELELVATLEMIQTTTSKAFFPAEIENTFLTFYYLMLHLLLSV